jgi:hypothetical protein
MYKIIHFRNKSAMDSICILLKDGKEVFSSKYKDIMFRELKSMGFSSEEIIYDSQQEEKLVNMMTHIYEPLTLGRIKENKMNLVEFSFTGKKEYEKEFYKNSSNKIVTNPILEDLAHLQHEQWSGWMQYLFSKNKINDDGSFTIPKEFVERWKRQIETKYKDLSESEKEADRIEARKYLHFLDKKK